MNNHNEAGSGGAPYTPKARKSIHNHDHCIFTECSHSMGRYGLKQSNRTKKIPFPNENQGVDEVDNVISKFSRSSSPLRVRREGRRNSLNSSANRLTDDTDSDSDNLSKSLPAKLPSNYCSEEFKHQSLPSDFYNSHISTIEKQATSRSREYITNETSGSHNSDLTHEYEQEDQTPQQNQTTSKQILLPIVGIISILAAIYFNSILDFAQEKDGKNSKSYDEFKFNKDMMDLGDKYKIDDHSILEVQTGLSTIFEKNDTGSFIFLYNSKLVNFNYERLGDFMKDIATTAARYLRSTTVQPTVVYSSQLNMNTHSELMNRYRGEVAKSGVMLLKDLDSVPPSLAMAFHYFCDEYNPLVAKTAIFFTLNLAKCSNTSDQRSSYADVEKCLTKKWNAIPEDNIKPLLARVVNVIIDVRGIS